jgi:hypothetical protein
MGRRSEDKTREMEAGLRRQRIEFDNYEKAVTLVSSLERWVIYMWGKAGNVRPTLLEFDRFPSCGERELTPDFLATFSTGYRLCGEVVKTFRTGPESDKDVRQVLSYAAHLWESAGNGACGDVLLLVSPQSDTAAAEAISAARGVEGEQDQDRAPIAIVSYMLDTRALGDWYVLQWREGHGNCRFSAVNVVEPGQGDDLNALIADASQCAIQVDAAALDIFSRNPLINDAPPPLYTAAVIVYPAIIVDVLTEDDRDEIHVGRTVAKRLSRDSLMATPFISGIKARPRHIGKALEFMVEYRLATHVADTTPQEYLVPISLRLCGSNLRDYLGEHVVSFDVRKLLGQRKRASRRSTNQFRLFRD